MTPAIAIVGMACCYPDARSPVELWENVLAQRRAFRRIPPERLSLADYFSTDKSTPDCTYGTEAALIAGYEFDRVDFRVVGSTFRSADLVHWLALDIAAQALADAGFTDGKNLPRETTGVLLGNTLTGEFSRANSLRLRWPYVRRVVEAQLIQQGMSENERLAFLKDLESKYKQPFPDIGEESLAGNLSNTIAGRICNHFDLKGGGYTIDGACSSSLLAIANACSALVTEDLDVAVAGGVDLSLDPFELVGFAKVGALATQEMRVYDARSAGFIPGEGCGFVVLMRYEDAVAQQHRIYGVIRGWGISSDGNGGITRPEVEGQLLAIKRAYDRAGFGIDTLGYFEGHGTGTSVGDATELQVLSFARLQAGKELSPAAISSIKANIGHTKAAAGIAGLIKATMALHTQILPPTTGCDQPHPQLKAENPPLRVLKEGQPWSKDVPLRAGVSAMGFGGINTHIVLEGTTSIRRQKLTLQERNLIATPQDAELILLAAKNTDELEQKVDHLLEIAPRLSRAEVGDLAAELAKKLDINLPVKAAVVASQPQELTTHLQTLKSQLSVTGNGFDDANKGRLGDTGINHKIHNSSGVFLGIDVKNPRIGFLFPGQASPVYLNGGAWSRRFPFLEELYANADLPTPEDTKSTAIAQPAIVTSSIAGLQLLNYLGLTADIAIGHSLGELSALHWAGVFDETALVRIAKMRGQAMAQLGNPTGTMASIGAGEQEVKALLNGRVGGSHCVIAGLNSPHQTIISGEATGINAIVEKAKAKGLKTFTLPVSHAFHSPLVAAAAQPLAAYLPQEDFHPLQGKVVSTITGTYLEKTANLRSLLVQQVTSPVQFMEAVNTAAKDLDLFIEVGPGQILSRLVSDLVNVPVVALDTSGSTLKGLLKAVASAFTLGMPINHQALFAGRFTRPFNLDWQPQFFVNPCELAPVSQSSVNTDQLTVEQEQLTDTPQQLTVINSSSKIDCVRQLVAQRTELPVESILDDHRLLSDLHLNSITVSQLVVEAARSLGLSPPIAPTDYADATVAEIGQALEELSNTSNTSSVEQVPAGVDWWLRTFTVELLESPLEVKNQKSKIKSQDSQEETRRRGEGETRRHQIADFDGGGGPLGLIAPDTGHRTQSAPRPRVPASPRHPVNSTWQIIAPPNYSLTTPLQQAFNQCQGSGVVICLPPTSNEKQIELLLEGAKTLLAKTQEQQSNQNSFVLVQHGSGGGSFARTFYLENPQTTTCVIDVPIDHPQAVEWIITEASSAVGYSEAYYNAKGIRRSPVLCLLPIPSESSNELTLTSKDILLVTGGGKGIAAECALSIAQETGVRLALLGRSQPETDPQLATNLARMTSAGIQVKYLSADVTDAEAVRSAVSQIETDWGPISAIIHGAGINQPKLIKNLDRQDCLNTVAPKVHGLQNLLEAINPEHLRLLVTFGSIIASTGLPGEADYALANEWLARLTKQFQTQNSHCRCLNLEWSIWSGAGMGERLGRIDALIQQGITPITPDRGIAILRRLIAQSLPTTSIVVTGRFGVPPTLKLEYPQLPFLRFLEQPRVHYPGVELVVDAELSTTTDPYLNDHVYQGERIFPGVMGLEAMAQVAMALLETSETPNFEDIKFNRPVVIPEGKTLTIRLAALVKESGKVKVVLRSEQTAFSVEHFQATLVQSTVNTQHSTVVNLNLESQIPNSLDPQQDVYGEILFHKGRFQSLRRYLHLKATECIAEIIPKTSSQWFSPYLPQDFVLGDPGARDATIHALQACIPHATILPIAVKSITIHSVNTLGNQFVSAKERQHIGVLRSKSGGDRFIYDITVFDKTGTVLEQWESLELQVIQHRDSQESWNAVLLPTYLERRLSEVIPNEDLTIVVDRDATVEKRVRSDRSLLQIQNSKLKTQNLYRRPDGKLESNHGKAVSVSHAGDLTLVVAGAEGCDVEPIVVRNEPVWSDLLGVRRLDLAKVIAQETGEALDVTATRIWCASECLKKGGIVADAPLLLMNHASPSQNETVWLESGERAIATFVVSVHEMESPLVFAVLLKKQELKESDRVLEEV
ncbi:MAG: type I polyketide synthase [Calothrix sp. MO_167.B12]|nr:type I polyketide synthase [Calothrix sp. MO_167.B12]